MTEQQLQREIKSGWMRTLVTTLAGIFALASSTYVVVAKITRVQVAVENNSRMIEIHNARIQQLENNRLPDGLERGQLQSTLRSVQISLEKIEERLDRIEQRYHNRAR